MDSTDAMGAPSGARSSEPGQLAVASLGTIVGVLLASASASASASTPGRTSGALEGVLAAAFLARLSGASHPGNAAAVALLDDPPGDAPAEIVVGFRRAIDLIIEEVARAATTDPSFAATMAASAERLRERGLDGGDEAAEATWSVFIPEAVGILGREAEREAELRAARRIRIERLADDPLRDPGREILFTSNVLLTLPASGTRTDVLPYPPDVVDTIHEAAQARQQFWYDHPIQIGVPPEGNELLYGLRGLDAAIGFERRRAPASDGEVPPVVCLLSVSVTHDALQRLARPYVEAELRRSSPLEHLAVFVVTEYDAQRLLDAVLAGDQGDDDSATNADAALRTVFGVDGEYGRHYSFLKAVAALWQVVADPAVRATFKFDLDQVFPQDVLVAETGQSAFEHLATPRWGATGTDESGREVELGMIAGALVNERDIGRGLFTPDVPYPTGAGAPDEHVFFSVVPQAVSTRAEMMTRYDDEGLDGTNAAIERIHVTGGTNGIRIDALRRHRPFTPSFVGRAEDQAYVLSTLGQPGSRLAYVHEPGLVMRHDKEAFAGVAIAAAHVGKLIGDDVRILVFSAYVGAVAGRGADGTLDRAAIKALLDPFTGAFVSRIPTTVVMIRYALRILDFFARGDDDSGRAYARDGARRIAAALDLTADASALRAIVERERAGWARFYDALDALEIGLTVGDPGAVARQRAARAVLESCRVQRPTA